MGEKARKIEREILKNLPPNKRLFKSNAGTGWQGEVLRRDGNTLILRNPRPLHAMPKGWPDLTGFESITITPDMVGKKIAVFVGEEIKAGSDTMKPAQKKFQKLIESFGGIYRIIRK